MRMGRQLGYIVLILCVCIVLDSLHYLRFVHLGIEGVIQPAVNVGVKMRRSATNLIRWVKFTQNGGRQVLDLERQVAELTLAAAKAQECTLENNSLRTGVKVLSAIELPKIDARVIEVGANEMSLWTMRPIRQELAKGVVSTVGLVGGEVAGGGRIVRVKNVEAKQRSVWIKLGEGEQVMALLGESPTGPRLTQIAHEAKLKSHELVITMGDDSVPPGLVVGEVGEMVSDSASIYQEAALLPLPRPEVGDWVWLITQEEWR